MAVINFTGFEAGNTTLANEVSFTGNAAIQSTVKRTGSYALQCNPAAGADTSFSGLQGFATTGLPLSFSVADFYCVFYFSPQTLPSSNDEIIARILGPATAWELRINASGVLLLYWGTTLVDTGSVQLVTDGTWYRIEWRISNTNSIEEVRINGTTELSGTQAVGGNSTTLLLGKSVNRNSNVVNFYYDDVMIRDDQWCGEGEVKLGVPIGAGAASGWTGGTSNTVAAINQIPHDTDTTYIEATATEDNQDSTWDMSSAATLGLLSTIVAVKTMVVARAFSASGTSAVRHRMLSGGTGYELDPHEMLTTYRMLARVDTTNPNGGAAWTSTAFDSIEVGMASDAIAQAQRFTAVYVSAWSYTSAISLVVADATQAHLADNVALTQTHVLAVDDANQSHLADNIALTEVIAIIIQDAAQAHLVDNVDLLVIIALLIDDVTQGHTADNIDLVQQHVLAIDDVAQAHLADNIDLIQQHVLAVDDATQAHISDNIDLTVSVALEIQDASHSQSADDVPITKQSDLEIQDSTQGHLVDNVDLVQQHVLVTQDATQEHTSENVVLAVGAISLTVQDATQAHTVDNVDVVQQHVLAIQDAAQEHVAENIDLIQQHILTVDGASQGHTADNITLVVGGIVLEVQEASQAHTTDNVDLIQQHVLSVDDTLQGHVADEVSILQTHILAIAEALQAHSADNIDLVVGGIGLDVAESTHIHSADEVVLTQLHLLTVDDAIHSHTSNNVDIGVEVTLEVQDATHSHTSNNVELQEFISLQIDNALHGHLSDIVSLVQQHILVIDDALHGHSADNVAILGALYRAPTDEEIAFTYRIQQLNRVTNRELLERSLAGNTQRALENAVNWAPLLKGWNPAPEIPPKAPLLNGNPIAAEMVREAWDAFIPDEQGWSPPDLFDEVE